MKWNITPDELEREYHRVEGVEKRKKTMLNIMLGLATASAISILVAVLYLPILQIRGESMTPSLIEDNLVISVKNASFERGDVVSFYYNNTILVKRAIAFAGEWVDFDEQGNVYVNGVQLEESYVVEPARGTIDIKLPYQVPDGCVFVLGDHRETSKDSRVTSMGCIPMEKFVGKIVYRVWPLNAFGAIQ